MRQCPNHRVLRRGAYRYWGAPMLVAKASASISASAGPSDEAAGRNKTGVPSRSVCALRQPRRACGELLAAGCVAAAASSGTAPASAAAAQRSAAPRMRAAERRCSA